MTKIDIFSGFLGAGKTTLIKKLIKEAYTGEKLVLIENEFGEIGIDGGFMQDAGITINEMNSGCICCSLVGDFAEALNKVIKEYAPDRILIEPSGVGKLSDVVKAVQGVETDDVVINTLTCVVDAKKAKMYIKNFGEFYNNQVESASCIIFSHVDGVSDEKSKAAYELIREKNANAVIVTTSWDKLDGDAILEAMENKDTLALEMEQLKADTMNDDEHHHHHHHDEDGEHEHHHHHHDGEEEHECCHHHHHHDDEEEHECCHHHHHHDDEEEHECCHHHHHHDDEEEHECCHHHHHHDDEDECGCGHHHHHHHHADDVFASWGTETTKKFTLDGINEILSKLGDETTYGIILRAKGIVEGEDGEWIHFDYVPGESDVRNGSAGVTGRLCVIGSKINEQAIIDLFN